MISHRIKLFNLFGFEIHIDKSWILLALFIVWSLSAGYFPMRIVGYPLSTYWAMGITGAIGLFLSIILHEACHSLVARKYGLPMKGITLFFFGGIAEMGEEPKNPKTELLMALAGPACSIALSCFFFLIFLIVNALTWSIPLREVTSYLAFINLALAIFNMLPAFPLDGGRVLRSILWSQNQDIQRSTRTASHIGNAFGYVLMGFAILNLFSGNLITAVWWFLLGMFLKGAANLSYQQVLVRKMLSGEPVRRFMSPHPVVVSPSVSLDDLVDHYIYRYHHKIFPVVEDERLVGCIRIEQIREIPREQWGHKTVGDIAKPFSDENTIHAREDTVGALSRMNQTGNSRLLVTEKDKLVGVITLKDILNFLSLKLDLEGYESEKIASSFLCP